MDVLSERCAGLDVRRSMTMACVLLPRPGQPVVKRVQPFGAAAPGLAALVAGRAVGRGPCRHAGDGGLLDAGACRGRPHPGRGQCPAHQGRPRTQDGRQRRRVDRPAGALRIGAGGLRAGAADPRAARPDPVPWPHNPRSGGGKAALATGHKLLVCIWTMLTQGCAFRGLGEDFHATRSRYQVVNRCARKLKALGFNVVPDANTQPAHP